MEKSFGKGAVMKLGDNKGRRVSSTSSGSVTVDNALGVGGYLKEELSKYMDLKVQVRRQ